MAFTLHQSDDAAQAAQTMAAAVALDLAAALTTRARALLLVSGGRSPLAFFAALHAQPVDWRRLDVSLADERSVPPDHPEANARLVRENLLIGPAQAARWIGLMPQGVPVGPESATSGPASDAWQDARCAAERANADGQLAHPAVIVLGLGNDGHTASLFPDAPQWRSMQSIRDRYVAVQPQQAPHARVSLSLHALQQQGHCYLWAVGADKRATLARLQRVCEQIDGTPEAAAALAAAGPVACLMADPAVRLDVYCSQDA